MSVIKQRTPWWCWLAVLTFGFFSFVGLLAMGFKVKNYLWVGMGIGHGIIVLMFTDTGNWVIWLNLALIIYLFLVVRKEFWAHQLGKHHAQREAMMHERYQRQLEEEKIRLGYVDQLNNLKAGRGIARSWSCTGCGAENNNTNGTCEYCGVAFKG